MSDNIDIIFNYLICKIKFFFHKKCHVICIITFSDYKIPLLVIKDIHEKRNCFNLNTCKPKQHPVDRFAIFVFSI